MKNLRVAVTVVLCVILSLTAIPALAENAFAYADLSVNGVTPGVSADEASAVLGEPTSQDEPVVEAATGATLQTFRYTGLSLEFTDALLTDATLSDPAYAGPRGLKVGDPESALIEAFQIDLAQAKQGVLYSAGWVESLETPLPPCATLTTAEDGSLQYIFMAPVTPYSAETLESPENYLYENTAVLTVTVDAATRAITSLTWSVRPLAE